MKDYARSFYLPKAWKRTSRAVMLERDGMCERCGRLASVVHHKKYITPENINDPEITLNWDNLECLCHDCHNKEHSLKASLTYFDEDGSIKHVKESAEVREHKQATEQITAMLAKLAAQEPAGDAE